MSKAPMAATDLKPFELVRDTGDLALGVAALERTLRRRSLKEVLAQAGRTAVRKGATTAFNGMIPKPVDWYCFDTKDNDTTDWYPQGIACASEAGHSEQAVLVVTWYWKPVGAAAEKGIRLSFLNTVTRKYVHVLLVRPKADGTFAPINIHAGGIAWYGDLLYVADTTHGMRVFDMRDIFDLKAALGTTPAPGPYLGYQFVMAQVDAWRATAGAARFSFATVDRSMSPHVLVSGEYAEPGEAGRVARWKLGADGLLVTGDNGHATAMDAYTLPKDKIQGVQSHAGRWYLSQAHNSQVNGSLVVIEPTGKLTTRKFPVGPEDLTFWREKNLLWSVTEFRGKRAVFAVTI